MIRWVESLPISVHWRVMELAAEPVRMAEVLACAIAC
jgi:hypothetical protein